MEFPAVIICLLALSCVQNTMSYVSRQIRQATTLPAILNTNYNNTQLPYPIYPDYSSNVNQIQQSAAPTNMPQTITTTESPSTKSTSLLDTSVSKSVLQYARTYAIYAIQVLMIGLLGTSLLNYICSQWAVCDNIFGENNFWKNSKAKRMNRSYGTSNYLDDISSTVFKAIDYYSKQ